MRCASSALEDSIMQILTFLFSMRELRRGITVGENYKKVSFWFLKFEFWRQKCKSTILSHFWKWDIFGDFSTLWELARSIILPIEHATLTHTQKSQKLSKKTSRRVRIEFCIYLPSFTKKTFGISDSTVFWRSISLNFLHVFTCLNIKENISFHKIFGGQKSFLKGFLWCLLFCCI